VSLDEIVPNLFIGARSDVGEMGNHRGSWVVICTLELPSDADRAAATLCLPVLEGDSNVATEATLEALRLAIRDNLRAGRRVLVHCGAGVERSPLAVAYYLHRDHGLSWDAAYALLQRRRPQVADRRSWLAPGLAAS